ncbi:MBL fold metallo-hydrolase [Kutzneria sp. CA-103260]|uniref:MBL fold metallo-hydrolase n=1 Tax=Kutzneria sp. CA-103260 TaxID=2802641 RepID=UPI001BA8C6F5|nr:MBL fold metallo-hydrolase [Kutzneria sp. CA-103260]QUQ64802.1 metallo-beta-lactamase superfamily protein [Kutzneria sp. CA-103260]
MLALGITRVATSKSENSYLVDGEDGLTVVDAGRAGAVHVLLKAAADVGRPIVRILLTHAHPDHVQGAPALREKTGAQVLVHSADAGWLAKGRVPVEGRSGAMARRYDGSTAGQWTPLHADDTVEDGDVVGGLRVIHTPGHSPGHIVLLHEPTRCLLAGDAVFRTGKLSLGPAGFAADPEAQAAAVARIPDDLNAIGFGHGEPLTGPEMAAFDSWRASAKAAPRPPRQRPAPGR